MSGFLTDLYGSPISTAIRDSGYVIPAAQSVHIIGVCVVFGAALIGDLKILRVWPSDEPLDLVARRFMPWLFGGLVVIACSGLANALGEPTRVFGNWLFWVKMALLAVAIAITLVLRAVMYRGRAEAGVRFLALISIATWVAIIICGRWIAYVAP